MRKSLHLIHSEVPFQANGASVFLLSLFSVLFGHREESRIGLYNSLEPYTAEKNRKFRSAPVYRLFLLKILKSDKYAKCKSATNGRKWLSCDS